MIPDIAKPVFRKLSSTREEDTRVARRPLLFSTGYSVVSKCMMSILFFAPTGPLPPFYELISGRFDALWEPVSTRPQ